MIAPTAALSSMPYTPFYSIQMLLNLHYNCPKLHTPGGFGDGYSFVDDWYFKGRIAIDQAPIVIMIENYRSGFLWKLLANHPDIRKGMEKAGIHLPVHPTGFPYAIADTRTGYYDMLRHPDRKMYELDFYLEEADKCHSKSAMRQAQKCFRRFPQRSTRKASTNSRSTVAD